MAEQTGRSEALGVSEFKRRCLELVERTGREGGEVVITKRGRPIARLVPYERPRRSVRGLLRGAAEIRGDIVDVDWSEDWEALR